jgi:hypothetical protein
MGDLVYEAAAPLMVVGEAPFMIKVGHVEKMRPMAMPTLKLSFRKC